MGITVRPGIKAFFGVKSHLDGVMIWASFIVVLAILVLIGWFVLPQWGQLRFLRLHYTAALGIDWAGDWHYIFVFPALAVAVLVLNGWMAGRLSRRQRLLGSLTLALTLVFELLIAIGGGIAVILNI